MNSEFEHDPAARLIVETLNTEPPADVETRLRERLSGLRTRLATQPPPLPGRQTLHRRAVRAVLAATALLAAALIAISPLIGPNRAWAQVAEAVAKKTWLHAAGTGVDGERTELWFSAKHGILGFRSGKSCVLVDQQQQTMDVYGPPADAESIQRMPLKHVNTRGITTAQQSFLALLTGNVQRAMTAGDQRLREHETRTVVVDGRELIEHRFVVAQGTDETESVLRVDPATGLPNSWTMKHGGQTLGDFQVTYPDRGPLTIVALGAPADAKIVDQTPSVEFQRILAATTGAARRFDNYRAIVVETIGDGPASAWSQMYRIWRKGNRWRVDQVRPAFQGRAAIPAGEDPRAWWLAQFKDMKGYPREIWDGKQFWLFDPVFDEPRQPDPDDPRFLRLAGLKVTPRQEMDPVDPTSPQHANELPESYGYDHLKLGTALNFGAEVADAELDGEPRLRVDLINRWSKEVDRRRYWLDPQRGNLIVRKEFFRGAEPAAATGISEVVEAAQTPQGLWYPTTMRMPGNSVSLEDGTRSDTYVRYYLDFDADIPDELFDAGAVNLNHPWTVVK